MDDEPTGPELMMPAALPDARAARPGRRRTVLVVLPLLAGLVAAGAYGGSLLWQGPEDPSPAAGQVTCWDGSQAGSAQECRRPRGTDGLVWVFPSFRPAELDCLDELERNPEFNRPAMWTCTQQVGGRPVEVTYSQVTGARAALRYFDKQLGGAARSTGRWGEGKSPVHTWSPSQAADGTWSAAVLLRDGPFAVSVTADSRSVARKALQRRVEIRPPDERRARPGDR